MVPDYVYGDVWVINVSAIHSGVLEMSFLHLSFAKDHFHVSHVCLGGMCEAADDAYGHGLVIHISAVNVGGLEMSLWHLSLTKHLF